MSLHRVTAGSGYDYLTRQVAAMDSTEKGHTGLATYYSERGESPGQWMGSGLAGIDGLNAGDPVTSEQMQALFGAGHHPLAAQRVESMATPGMSEKELLELTRLGKPYLVYDHDISDFRIEVARRLEVLNKQRGVPRNAKVAIGDRANIRTQVAREMFTAEFGRAPDDRELAGQVARLSRQHTTAVAGFDLTFSPVKSVSTLWALSDPHTAAQIEKAHNQAVADTLKWIEANALYSRVGAGGVRQVDVNGLIAAAFVHRDSRAGDPDLHTHVAVANKVQTHDGRWLAIDGRVLFKAAVTASETYNTALEAHLAHDLGIEFAVRPSTDPRKRPIREIVGIDPAINERWSSRRAAIEARRNELVAEFQASHHRPPIPAEAIALAQQATLETRQAKHEPRTVAEQRAAWRRQAEHLLGGADAVTTMVSRAVGHRPCLEPGPAHDEIWLADTAAAVVDRVQQDRSTWQIWHIRAEALRAARAATVPIDHLGAVVDQIVDTALAQHSILLQCDTDGITEPRGLQRTDGTSVYDVAGAQMYSSTAIIGAERRLVGAAGERGGFTVEATAVDLALLESQANGVVLNAGQALLVREMASSGARLQLAIAPAGSGKTTAMSALASAWCAGGGNVIGLSPSAAAAAALGEQLRGDADTLAKLIWDIGHGREDAWHSRVGPNTLLVVDEAGMADTLSLDAAVQFALDRGASVRLIGDDQQLAAIGAGGVLRDIQATHGALRLAELMRFSDAAEAAASLALRQGHTEALGFYLDHSRVLVGDQVTMAEALYTAWASDQARGMDSVMLAPTRELVASLNQRARQDRLGGTAPHRCVDLADGNQASAGDTIITRLNNRQLRLSASDFVKNGDRFEVVRVAANGSIKARHLASRRTVLLPPEYVAGQTELGYASTTYTAQGITADTMHGLLSGDESRQQAYTMLTRGRHLNRAYVVVVGDGDAHTAIQPDTINPLTPTDILERILAKDESPVSATTSLRQATDPRHLLGLASARYADAITFAAEFEAGTTGIRALERAVDDALPRITEAANWPSLRAQLIQTQASGNDPLDALAKACNQPLAGAQDPASVLAWRVADQRNQRGPLPWLPDIPQQLRDHPTWGAYLTRRHDLVVDLAQHVRTSTRAEQHMPEWVGGITGRPSAELIADVEVWRASNQVPQSDHRPTGEVATGMAATRWQRHLNQRLADSQNVALDEWRTLLNQLRPHLAEDPFAATLAHRLSQISSGGLDAAALVRAAGTDGPLPDDHAAAALWWRVTGRLTPDAASTVDEPLTASAWLDQFTQRVGTNNASLVQTSSWWPTLSRTIERGLQRGWQLNALLDEVAGIEPDGHADLCQAWVWRMSSLTDRLPVDDDAGITEAEANRPDDLDELLERWTPAAPSVVMISGPLASPSTEPEPIDHLVDFSDDDQLALEALVRDTLLPPEPTEADIRRQMDYRDQVAASPVSPDRLLHINEIAATFYEENLPGSWAQPYLEARFGAGVDELPDVRPGYAPAEWRSLLQHLSRHGISADEAIAAGLAKRNEDTGRTYDRLRDRVVFPVVHNGQVLGFVGRRNPEFTGDESYSPKYINSPDTALFHKGAQLFVGGSGGLDGDAVPVLVEGPMDAIAVTVASHGRLVGVAPLGTSLTEQQVEQLRETGHLPVVATDGDLAGRVAAERDYWLLSPAQLHATHAALPDDTDPASMVEEGQSSRLLDAIAAARPLAESLIDERLANIEEPSDAVLAAVQVLAAQPSAEWSSGAEYIAQQTGIPSSLVRFALLPRVQAWNADPRRAGQAAWQASQVKDRLAARRAEQWHRDNPETAKVDTARPQQSPDLPPTRRGIDR